MLTIISRLQRLHQSRGWKVDKVAPDRIDLIGGIIALLGVLVIMYWPRR